MKLINININYMLTIVPKKSQEIVWWLYKIRNKNNLQKYIIIVLLHYYVYCRKKTTYSIFILF